MSASPTEFLHQGKVDEALAALQAQVREQPAVVKHRIFLFQLLCVAGQWDRALNQLNVCREMDASTLVMAQTYQEAIACEAFRAEVFAGRRTPVFFGQPAEWMALVNQALALTVAGRHGEAQRVREGALEAAAPSAGALTVVDPGDEASSAPRRVEFEWIADADMRLGPVLEAVVNGKYYWIPFERIHRIEFEAPTDLRDAVWTPARFTWVNGGTVVGLVPTRYPGSESQPEGLLRLARRTDWLEVGEGVFHGLGQRMLATESGEFPLMDLRTIELHNPPTNAEANEGIDG
ncbi:MAG: type VI secretion system accessory protein TagJ [Planctomycetota bacterium]